MNERNGSHQDSEHIYPVGKWFNPFQNYEDRELHKSSDVKYEYKKFPMVFDGIGSVTCKTLKFVGEGDCEGVILTPAVTIPFTYGEIKPFESVIAAPFLDFEFSSKGRLDDLQVEIRLGEDGDIYSSRFYSCMNSSDAGMGHWFNASQFTGFLQVPEREYIVGQMQARIISLQ